MTAKYKLIPELKPNSYAGSTGKLVATRIWEGGDTIDQITIEDGVVTEETIEL